MALAPHHRGFFLTLEGGEGSGKSTHIHGLIEYLYANGYPCVVTRDPGGTGIGDNIRQILLDHANTSISDRTELLLYQATRAQLVHQVIRPALEHDAIVISDRFFDSTTAYQGYGRGLDLTLIHHLTLAATGGLHPDCTILLDIDPAIGLTRIRARHEPDRLERQALAFHQRVRQGYLLTAQHEPDRFVIIDASLDPLTIQAQLRTVITDRLRAHRIHPATIPVGDDTISPPKDRESLFDTFAVPAGHTSCGPHSACTS